MQSMIRSALASARTARAASRRAGEEAISLRSPATACATESTRHRAGRETADAAMPAQQRLRETRRDPLNERAPEGKPVIGSVIDLPSSRRTEAVRTLAESHPRRRLPTPRPNSVAFLPYIEPAPRPPDEGQQAFFSIGTRLLQNCPRRPGRPG